MNILKQFKKDLDNKIGAMGMNERNLTLIHPHNRRKNYKWADDKILSKGLLEAHDLPHAETYAVIGKIGEIESKWEAVAHHDSLAIKPSKGSGGNGIMVLRKNKDGQWMSGSRVVDREEIFYHLANIVMGLFSKGAFDRALIEECIEPHEFFQSIYPKGVPDLRVILLKGQPLLAMLRLPTDRSDGKANIHQGGLGVGLDMKDGTLTEVYDGEGYVDVHPDTDLPIKGLVLPYWEETLAICKRTCEAFPLDFLGVDVVLDKKHGPMIMEVNVRPGLAIQIANRCGLKTALKKIDIP